MAGVAALENAASWTPGGWRFRVWSYGGYMTTWLLGNYPERWKAAVAGAAVTDWFDQYNYGDANVRRGAAFGRVALHGCQTQAGIPGAIADELRPRRSKRRR